MGPDRTGVRGVVGMAAGLAVDGTDVHARRAADVSQGRPADGVREGEPAAVVDQIAELAACGVEELVLELLAADGPELDAQMVAFAERVRPRCA